ncbi:uncharacterized protein LOC106131122 [Amyelois transitella]|uniref:uncharacterized protein LOC106131122 n=1 Tax=Amyelois transitella TaxID=680683 RepID=UPI00298FB8FD|nr:uncharacterized protein LOC106131122 [Amyelois transitella]
MAYQDQEILKEYCNSISKLKKECLNEGLTEREFQELYFKSLKFINMQNIPTGRQQNRFFTNRTFLLMGILIVTCVVYNYKILYSGIVCNLQEYIYPGLRLLRRISIPFISLFPSLTEYYHETCLIQNPFFTVVDMDCWPCSSVSNIREVQNPKPVSQQQNAPFIYQADQIPMGIDSIKSFYEKNKNVIDKEQPKILTNNMKYETPDGMLSQLQKGEKNLYIWKFNTMNTARVLRQVISRPKVVPKFGQSTERFLIIDTRQESFQVPDTECSFSFLLLLNGSRTISLEPAAECKHQCKSLKVDLKESYLLWYNWWYWRPKVQPSNGNITMVAHIGSYC